MLTTRIQRESRDLWSSYRQRRSPSGCAISNLRPVILFLFPSYCRPPSSIDRLAMKQQAMNQRIICHLSCVHRLLSILVCNESDLSRARERCSFCWIIHITYTRILCGRRRWWSISDNLTITMRILWLYVHICFMVRLVSIIEQPILVNCFLSDRNRSRTHVALASATTLVNGGGVHFRNPTRWLFQIYTPLTPQKRNTQISINGSKFVVLVLTRGVTRTSHKFI